MTLSEIRALPQELVEAFEKDHVDLVGEDFSIEARSLECWLSGAGGVNHPCCKHHSAGYAYWLGKRGKK